MLVSTGYTCMMNQALYPIERIEWCIYALFIKDPDRIATFCLVETKVRHAKMAVSLEGYMWAISSMATTNYKLGVWLIPT